MGGPGQTFREAGNTGTVWCACDDDVESRNKSLAILSDGSTKSPRCFSDGTIINTTTYTRPSLQPTTSGDPSFLSCRRESPPLGPPLMLLSGGYGRRMLKCVYSSLNVVGLHESLKALWFKSGSAPEDFPALPFGEFSAPAQQISRQQSRMSNPRSKETNTLDTAITNQSILRPPPV
jgi:hypothetical protein